MDKRTGLNPNSPPFVPKNSLQSSHMTADQNDFLKSLWTTSDPVVFPCFVFPSLLTDPTSSLSNDTSITEESDLTSFYDSLLSDSAYLDDVTVAA